MSALAFSTSVDDDLYGPCFDPEDDMSGLCAWVDDDGTFYAVGADDVVRSYDDGPHHAERLQADLRDPAEPGATLNLAPYRMFAGTIDDDPDYQLLNRATLAVIVLFVLYMALQFAGAWLGGRL